MGAWALPDKPRSFQNEFHEEELAADDPVLEDPVLEGAGNNVPIPFTPFVNAPELYRYNPMPSATMMIMMNQIFAPIIIK
jgi:hypothetical protein